MKKIPFLLLALVTAFAVLMSCDNDDNATSARSPEFGDITLTPNPCHAGDTVKATVSYNYAGKEIYQSVYFYNVKGSSNTGDSTFYSSSWSVTDPTKSVPSFQFVAPDIAQTYTVTFGASKIHYATGGPNGELYGSAASVSTTLRVRASN